MSAEYFRFVNITWKMSEKRVADYPSCPLPTAVFEPWCLFSFLWTPFYFPLSCLPYCASPPFCFCVDWKLCWIISTHSPSIPVEGDFQVVRITAVNTFPFGAKLKSHSPAQGDLDKKIVSSREYLATQPHPPPYSPPHARALARAHTHEHTAFPPPLFPPSKKDGSFTEFSLVWTVVGRFSLLFSKLF